LSAVVGDPHGDFGCKLTFLLLAGAGGLVSAGDEGAHGEFICVESHHLVHDVCYLVGHVIEVLSLLLERSQLVIFQLEPAFLYRDLNNVLQGDVDCLQVEVDDFRPLVLLGLADVVLQQCDGFLRFQHSAEPLEHRLHDVVDTFAKSRFVSNVLGVHKLELSLFLSQLALDSVREVLLHVLQVALDAVVDHDSPLLEGVQTVEALDLGLVVDADVVRVAVDHLLRIDPGGPHAQVGDGAAVSLLTVLGELALHFQVGFDAHGLDGCLVGPDGAVTPQPPEDELLGALGEHVDGGALLETQVGHVVFNAHEELGFAVLVVHVVLDALNHGGRELLA